MKRISREEENAIPRYNNYLDMCEYFKVRYGKAFVFAKTDRIDGLRCYFHHLILDEQTYRKGLEELEQNGYLTDSLAFLDSYQSIEILENGALHIVH